MTYPTPSEPGHGQPDPSTTCPTVHRAPVTVPPYGGGARGTVTSREATDPTGARSGHSRGTGHSDPSPPPHSPFGAPPLLPLWPPSYPPRSGNKHGTLFSTRPFPVKQEVMECRVRRSPWSCTCLRPGAPRRGPEKVPGPMLNPGISTRAGGVRPYGGTRTSLAVPAAPVSPGGSRFWGYGIRTPYAVGTYAGLCGGYAVAVVWYCKGGCVAGSGVAAHGLGLAHRRPQSAFRAGMCRTVSRRDLPVTMAGGGPVLGCVPPRWHHVAAGREAGPYGGDSRSRRIPPRGFEGTRETERPAYLRGREVLSPVPPRTPEMRF